MHSILLGSLVVFYTNLTRSRSSPFFISFFASRWCDLFGGKDYLLGLWFVWPLWVESAVHSTALYPSLSVLLSISFSILFWRFAVTTVAACSTHPFPRPSSAWLLLTETVRTVCWIRESSQLKLTAKLKSENEFVISFTATFAHFTVSWYSCHWGFWVNAFTRIPFFVGFP